ncbi:MAG: hypothetical protein PHU71_05300 [Candidatus Gracilibacteria bacterium]|nr:hypothetical protein [Candidatus Gracilibacteria bacterium]
MFVGATGVFVGATGVLVGPDGVQVGGLVGVKVGVGDCGKPAVIVNSYGPHAIPESTTKHLQLPDGNRVGEIGWTPLE